MLKWIIRTLFFIFGSFLGAQVIIRLFLRVTPLNVPDRLNAFLATPARRLYRDPGKVIDLLGVHRNSVILDAGCAKGIFTVEAARRVGQRGLVHAVDRRAKMIELVARRLDVAQLGSQVQLTISPLDAMPIENDSVDAAMMISALPTIPDRLAALKEIKRVLKPGGVLVIGEELLEPQYVRPIIIQEWTLEAGFKLVGRSGSPFSYLLKFVKPVSVSEVAGSNEVV